MTRPRLGFFLILFGLVASWTFWRASRPAPLVVYCAHDAVYSEKILQQFERRTGIPVAVRFDTEATKSLGLVELIEREQSAPRCDVFWNNELLGMLRLDELGLLEPYQGSGFSRIPARFKDPQGHWTGFAARLRVYIGNTDALGHELTEAVVEKRLADPDLSGVAIAKPLYGTTLTHYSLLWQQWGGERLRAWHADWRERGVRQVNGNGAVKDAVASGVSSLGWTDTDDFFDARDAGRPLAMLPVRLKGGATICIPNTVAILRGTQRSEAARQLVDALLSAETELALARSPARQIPLGPVTAEELPPEVRELRQWASEAAPLAGLSAARAECLAWLKSEMLR